MQNKKDEKNHTMNYTDFLQPCGDLCKSSQIWHEPTVIWCMTHVNTTNCWKKGLKQHDVFLWCNFSLAGFRLLLRMKTCIWGTLKAMGSNGWSLRYNRSPSKDGKKMHSPAAFSGSSVQDADKGGKLITDSTKLRNKNQEVGGQNPDWRVSFKEGGGGEAKGRQGRRALCKISSNAGNHILWTQGQARAPVYTVQKTSDDPN